MANIKKIFNTKKTIIALLLFSNYSFLPNQYQHHGIIKASLSGIPEPSIIQIQQKYLARGMQQLKHNGYFSQLSVIH